MNDLLTSKLDIEIFAKVFPMNKQPSEHLKSLRKQEAANFNDRIVNMIKLWDQKIANLRNELNIQGIYRKLEKFPKKEEVQEKIDVLHATNSQTQNSLLQLKIMIGKVGQMNADV